MVDTTGPAPRFDVRQLQVERRRPERPRDVNVLRRSFRLRAVAAVIVIAAVPPPCIAQEPALQAFEIDGRAALTDFVVRSKPGGEREVAGSLSETVSIEIDGRISVEQAAVLLAGPELKSVRFGNKEISDDHLRGLANQRLLAALNLRATTVSGRFLDDLSQNGERPNLTLRSIDLGETVVTDEDLARLKACPLLRSLKLRNTAVTDAGLKHLESLDFLEELDLGETRITLAGVARLARIRTLRTLWLPIHLNSDEVAERLVGLSQLEKLHGPRRFSDEGLRSLGRLPNLKSMSVWDSPNLTGKGLSSLSDLSCLTELELVRCGIRDEDLTHLQSQASLRTLYIASCERLTDDALVRIGALTRLRSLTLEDLSITDRGAANLKTLADLEELGLRGTRIGDAAMESIAGLENLRRLDLMDTEVKSAGLYRLSRLRRLEWLGAAAFERDDRLRNELVKTLKYVHVGSIFRIEPGPKNDGR